MYLTDQSGNILGTAASPLIMQLATQLTTDDNFWVPAALMGQVPVSHIAYANNIALPSGPTNLMCSTLTDSSAGATAILQVPFLGKARYTAGKGITLTGITVFWSLTTTDLTAGPSAALVTVTFVGPDAGGDAATRVATVGGTITPNPATTQTAHGITAGNLYATNFAFGSPYAVNNPTLAEVYAELSFPCGIGSVVYVAGANWTATDQP